MSKTLSASCLAFTRRDVRYPAYISGLLFSFFFDFYNNRPKTRLIVFIPPQVPETYFFIIHLPKTEELVSPLISFTHILTAFHRQKNHGPS